jgi:hypothetical protein
MILEPVVVRPKGFEPLTLLFFPRAGEPVARTNPQCLPAESR